jgi:hypothetical protein
MKAEGHTAEESDSWLKTYVWFVKSDHRQLQRLYLGALMGENLPSLH